MKLVVVDSGCANVSSVTFALERLGARVDVSASPDVIRAASHVVLPGVGTAETFMTRVRERGLIEPIRTLRQPCLGICLGMQLMFERSDEGDTDAMGIFPGEVRRLPEDVSTTVPHMGWNRLELADRPSVLLDGVEPGAYVYFVHSFYVPQSDLAVASATHGVPLTAAVEHENYFGCQFHPERSGAIGARVLANFLSAS